MEIVHQHPDNPKLRDLPYGTRFKFTDKHMTNCEYIYAIISIYCSNIDTNTNTPAIFNPNNGIVTPSDGWLAEPVVVIKDSPKLVYANLKCGDVFKFVGNPIVYMKGDSYGYVKLCDGSMFSSVQKVDDPVELVPGAFVVGYQLPSKNEAGI